MDRTWSITEARNKLSEVVDATLSEGPQTITRRGVEVAVVISHEEYRKLRLRQMTLMEFFRASPLVGVELDLTRDDSLIREENPCQPKR